MLSKSALEFILRLTDWFDGHWEDPEWGRRAWTQILVAVAVRELASGIEDVELRGTIQSAAERAISKNASNEPIRIPLSKRSIKDVELTVAIGRIVSSRETMAAFEVDPGAFLKASGVDPATVSIVALKGIVEDMFGRVTNSPNFPMSESISIGSSRDSYAYRDWGGTEVTHSREEGTTVARSTDFGTIEVIEWMEQVDLLPLISPQMLDSLQARSGEADG